MSDIDLTAIRERCDAATDGPWLAATSNRRKSGYGLVGRKEDRGTGKCIAVFAGAYKGRTADAEFTAAARSDVPALLAEVERLRRIGMALWRGEQIDPDDWPELRAFLDEASQRGPSPDPRPDDIDALRRRLLADVESLEVDRLRAKLAAVETLVACDFAVANRDWRITVTDVREALATGDTA